MTGFKETNAVIVDDEGYAAHKKCGTRLVESWTITNAEDWSILMTGGTELVGEDESGRDCDGVWCDACDERIVLEPEGRGQ